MRFSSRLLINLSWQIGIIRKGTNVTIEQNQSEYSVVGIMEHAKPTQNKSSSQVAYNISENCSSSQVFDCYTIDKPKTAKNSNPIGVA